MTKAVRIENADLNTHDKIRVTVQVKDPLGNWVDSPYETPTKLEFPTSLGNFGVWSQKRLIVEEYNDPPAANVARTPEDHV